MLDRLYTSDKTMSIAVVILAATTGIYYDVLKNNVDFDKSFNGDLMVHNTLTDPNSALFYSDQRIQDCKVNHSQCMFFEYLVIF